MSQQQGNDMVAPNSKPTRSELESAQSTIEDKLAKIIGFHKKKDRYYDYYDDDTSTHERDVTSTVNQLAAIITTETTKAREKILIQVDPYIDPEFRELFEALQKEQS